MIYFVQAVEDERRQTGPVKIGFTNNPDLRVRVTDLQVGNPYPLRVLGVIPSGTLNEEAHIHERFAKDWMYGEWFRYSERLEKFIRKYSSGYLLGASCEHVHSLPKYFKDGVLNPKSYQLKAQAVYAR